MILASYRNGGTLVELHDDGTKIRTILDPEDPPVFPEQMDLKITDWCDAGCAWCHERSTRRGAAGAVDPMLDLLAGMPAGAEIAIGGGDPLSHPEFTRLVRGLARTGLIANVTINARHLARHEAMLRALCAERLLFGVGISIHETLPDFELPNAVFHMIAGVDDPEQLLQARPGCKILVLGYKSFGRGAGFEARFPDRIRNRIDAWKRLLPLIASRHHLSFDNLAIHQLEPRRLFRSGFYEERYMGREGEYSLYVDGVRQEYATSSYAPDRRPWSEIRAMFADVRARNAVGF